MASTEDFFLGGGNGYMVNVCNNNPNDKREVAYNKFDRIGRNLSNQIGQNSRFFLRLSVYVGRDGEMDVYLPAE